MEDLSKVLSCQIADNEAFLELHDGSCCKLEFTMFIEKGMFRHELSSDEKISDSNVKKYNKSSYNTKLFDY